MPSLWYFCTIPSKFSLFVCVFVFFGGGWGGRFVENIPRHITPRSGFESFAEYTQRWPTSGPARKFMSAMLQGTYNGRAFTLTAASQVQCLSNTLPNIIAVMCNCKHCLLVWFPRGSLRPNPLCAVHRMLQGNSLFLSG